MTNETKIVAEEPEWPWIRAAMRWLMAIVYFGFGIFHMASPDAFLPIMPDWVPAPRDVVIATGVCEILGAIGLILPHTRRYAAIALAAYAICVFPANIKHAIYDIPLGGHSQTWWYHAPRLAFQPVLAWWPLFCAGLMNWPFPKRCPTSTSRA